jgi:hypothetical protein
MLLILYFKISNSSSLLIGFKSDLATNAQERYFLIAVTHNQIIGSIEFGPASELIQTCTNNALTGLPEVGIYLSIQTTRKKASGINS